ncbi:MAG TPA: hypothetical protein VHB20_16085 [Verrucomicrobiae bacterium]|nr:hypothetical protein [Verrucomicrobiae bacterium]
MQEFIDHILQRCHPQQLTYTRVDAAQLLRNTGVERSALDAAWPEIELALQKNNLIMVPALPDADDGEAVRVFRCDAPLTKVLLEVLYPTEHGDSLLTETIRAITQTNRSQPRPRPDRRPRNDRPRRNQGQRKGRPSPPSSASESFPTPNPMEVGSRTHFVRPLQ